MKPHRQNATEPDLIPLGQDGVLIRFSLINDPQVSDQVIATRHEIEAAGIDGVEEIAGSLTSALVRYDPVRISRTDLIHRLAKTMAQMTPQQVQTGRHWTIPATFDGIHMQEVCELTNQNRDRVITDIVKTALRVLAIGFAPGQPYLGLLPDHWNFPRQDHLTQNVPAGTIITAVQQLIPFATTGVTGWRQIGYCAFRAFSTNRNEPFVLQQGDMVRFEQVSESEMADIEKSNTDGMGGARCRAQL
nr:carboxyltransferase domain-containing protein [Pseudaestuariivita rosea]